MRGQVVDGGVQRGEAGHHDADLVALRDVGEPEGPAQRIEPVRGDRGGRCVNRHVARRAAAEVAQVLAERVQIEVGVLGGTVVLAVPVVDEHPAVHVPDPGRPAVPGLHEVLELVEPAIRANGANDEVMRWLPGQHRAAERGGPPDPRLRGLHRP